MRYLVSQRMIQSSNPLQAAAIVTSCFVRRMTYNASMGVTKEKRLDLRLTAEQRRQIERAAELRGQNLSDWATSKLMDAARIDIVDSELIRLTEDEFERFTAALEQPVPDAVAALMTRHTQWD